LSVAGHGWQCRWSDPEIDAREVYALGQSRDRSPSHRAAEAARFQTVNLRDGANACKINVILPDNGYNLPKAAEHG